MPTDLRWYGCAAAAFALLAVAAFTGSVVFLFLAFVPALAAALFV